MIDWFTVAAQLLNFLVLVALLKHFLYRPVLDAIEAREARIAAELADAADKQADAGEERDAFAKKNADLDRDRAALLDRATADAAAERERLLHAAGEAADGLAAKRRQALTTEAETLRDTLTRRAQDEVFGIARSTLADLAGVSLEERAAEVFGERVRGLDADAKGASRAGSPPPPSPRVVRSAFELANVAREGIQHALNETFSTTVPLRFETDPDLIAGIELTAGGQKIAWSIADHLARLQAGVAETLAGGAAAEASTP